jgi:hypothetical protein
VRRALTSWPTKSHVFVEHPRAQAAFDVVVGQLHERVVQEPRQPGPLPVEVAQGFAQNALGLHVAPARVQPGAQLGHGRSAVALPPLEALLEALAQALGLGVDVEDPAVELEPRDGACVAHANGFDQAAPALSGADRYPASLRSRLVLAMLRGDGLVITTSVTGMTGR